MRDRQATLNEIERTGVVAVVRAPSPDILISVAEALVAGGVTCVEITMSTPKAFKAIEAVADAMGERACVGVGTVLDAPTAVAAIHAGAEYVVSPTLSLDVIATAKRYGKVVVPGAFTPTEILTAWQAGADVVKVFPATKLGPEFFKDMRGPLPQIKMQPTGGVDLSTAGAFIKAGAVALGAGSALVTKKAMAEKDWAALTANAQAFIQAVADARAGK